MLIFATDRLDRLGVFLLVSFLIHLEGVSNEQNRTEQNRTEFRVRGAFTIVVAVVVLTLTMVSLGTTRASATSSASSWTMATLPMPPGVVNLQPFAISCPSISYCVAVGVNSDYGPSLNFPPAAWTMSDGVWSAQVLPMPPGNLLAAALGISCPSVGSCFAAGIAMTSGSATGNQAATPVEWTLSNGIWSVGALAMLNSYSSEVVRSISCSSATNCVAVGENSTIGTTNFTPVEWTLSNGIWSVGALAMPTAYPYGIAEGISCSAMTTCVAVGSIDTGNNTSGIAPVWTLSSAKWSVGVLPMSNGDPYGFASSVSCSGATSCIAVGDSTNNSTPNGYNPMAWTLSNGSWGYANLPVPSGDSPPLSPRDISCPSTMNCTVAGSDLPDGNESGVVWTLADGSWTSLNLPSSSVGFITGGSGFATGISCSEISNCAVVGVTIPGFGTNAAGISTPTAWTLSPTVSYAALGDSYSSGEGTGPPYLGAGEQGSVAASDTSHDSCHRSPLAYSEDLANENFWNLGFYACSGATTNGILDHGQHGEIAQIKDINSATNLVTITIGGNNVGFASVIEKCIEQRVTTDLVNGFSFGLLNADPSCVDKKNFVKNEDTVIENSYQALLTTFKTIRSRAPNASIIVLDYPLLFPTHSAGQGCAQLIPYLTGKDQNQFNSFAQSLDLFEHKAAFTSGVNFIDVQPDFRSHGVCGSSGAYINGLTITNGLLTPTGSFHPNATGQAQFASAVSSYITTSNQAGFPETPQFLPQNPPPGVDPPTRPAPVVPPSDLALIGQTPTKSYGNLAVTPLAADFNTACEGQFQAGQTVQIEGGGYAPQANVSIELTSLGHGSKLQQRIASVRANSGGSIQASVRIPLATIGFTLPSQSEGMVFVNARGTSGTSAKTRHVDIAIIGMAKASSQCGRVDPLGFSGFSFPTLNPPAINKVLAGASVEVRFSIPGINSAFNRVVATGSLESLAVSCSTKLPLGPSTPTSSSGDSIGDYPHPSHGEFTYRWQTLRSWTGCREFDLRLVDGTNHYAYFQFAKSRGVSENSDD